jgi:hypothetical protein
MVALDCDPPVYVFFVAGVSVNITHLIYWLRRGFVNFLPKLPSNNNKNAWN